MITHASERPNPIPLPLRTWGSGAGPAVLLVHGLTSSASTWSRIGAALAATGAVVTAPDLPGHGQAPVPSAFDNQAVAADLLAIEAPPSGSWDVVVGHSLGGAIAAIAGARAPGWARGMLLLDPVLTLPEDRGPLLHELGEELRHLDHVAISAAHPRWHEDDVTEKIRAGRRIDGSTVQAILQQPIDWNYGALVAGSAHTVVALGADPEVEDPSLTPQEGDALRQKGVRYEIVSGAGHSVHRDDPGRVLAEVWSVCSGSSAAER